MVQNRGINSSSEYLAVLENRINVLENSITNMGRSTSNIGSVLIPYQKLYVSDRIQSGSKIIDLSQSNSIGVNVPLKTTQDVFNDNELVDKKYVDDSISNIPVVDLSELETKTSNINISSTPTNTDFNGGFVSNGDVTLNNGNFQIQGTEQCLR